MRQISWLFVATLTLAANGAVRATDIPIAGRKLIVVDTTAPLGTGKVVFVAKDTEVSKGSGTDPGQIEATLHVAYDAVSGAFIMPRGGRWLKNSTKIAKYVNDPAPAGGAVKVSVIKPGTLLKVIAKSVGDSPLDISNGPNSPVYVTYAIANAGEEIRLCTQFARCALRAFADGGAYKLVCKGHSTGDPTCTASSTATSSSTSTSTTSSTTTTLASCTCGDGICQADEPLALCAEDCRIAHVATLPIAFGDCLFADYVNSEDCNQLPSSFSPAENACYIGGSSIQAIAVLPTECGGQGAVLALEVGDSVPVMAGSTSSILVALRDCWDNGIRDFVAPMVSCDAGCLSSSVTVVGFAPIRLTSRPSATGSPKGFAWSSLCSADGPCGLGICTGASGDCSTCPEDCGGCTPACP